MPFARRLKPILPYLVVLVGASYLYMLAGRIVYAPVPEQIGPDAWPKIVLFLLIAVCVAEILRQLFLPPAKPAGAALPSKEGGDDLIAEEEDHPVLVLCVGAATVVYLLLLETGGFFLCTLAYSSILIWTAGLRRLVQAAGLGLAITTFFTFVFMKIVFVALPIGVPPFATLSLGVMALLGIR